MKLRIYDGVRKCVSIAALGFSLALVCPSCSVEQVSQRNEIEIEENHSFEKGEHIVIVPIDDPTKEIKQYEYHEGYTPVGITASAYGEGYGSIGECFLIYKSEYPVQVYSTDDDVYKTFGKPIGYTGEEAKEMSDTKIFYKGQHILSIPLDKFNENTKIGFYDGYEVVGVCDSAFGAAYDTEGGGAILYINVEPVEVEKSMDEENNNLYLSFGNPVEEEKINEK